MSKTNESQWAKAKALYEKGESLRGIESITGIPYKTIDNRAKKNGWEKGSLAQLISDTVRVKTEFGTLETVQQEVVSNAVDERIKHKDFFNNAAIRNVQEAMKAPCENQNDFRARADTISKGREAVLGKVPDSAVQVNVGGSVADVLRQQNRLVDSGIMEMINPNYK